MTIHFHIGRVPVVIAIGETPVAPVLRELQEKDEVLLLTGLRFTPRERSPGTSCGNKRGGRNDVGKFAFLWLSTDRLST
jgi:hypothetical protein